jgi:signal transduction histidine kinase
MMDDFILSIKADDSSYQMSHILFDSLLDQAIYQVRGLAEDKQMKITVEENFHPLFVLCETRLLERVLINLLVNSIRYGLKGSSIDVHMKLINGDAASSRLVCEISNLIDPSPITSDVEHRGFGLGLGFVDQVIEKHQGTIVRKFSDQPNGLATISIELPCSFE